MSSLKNLQRVTYTNEMIMTLIKLYKFHGKEFYYANVLKRDAESFTENIVEIETTYLTKFLNLNVSENRLRLLISKDSNPKTNDETIVKNLKKVIEVCCDNVSNFELKENQILNLGDLIFKGVKRVQFVTNKNRTIHPALADGNFTSKRDDLQQLLDDLKRLIIEEQTEVTNLVVNFYIDFIHIKPFKEDNEFIGMMLIYILLFKYGFNQFKFVSFFEVLYQRREEFEKLVVEADYNWELGFSKVEPLNNFIVKILLDNYTLMEKKVEDYCYDAKLNKSDNIENTIYRLQNIFTKEDVAAKHPNVSETTIRRTLVRLRDEGKIKPLGVGRSAKWIKVNMHKEEFNPDLQLDIFSVINSD